jgi:adenine-specific DNA-methyltransferase
VIRLLDEELLPQIRAVGLTHPAADVTALEDEVFSHLCTFFRRYVECDVAATPRGDGFNHLWANPDQYFVRSADAPDAGRNAADLLVYKDLGGFLNKEIDAYIKNEVVQFGEIDDESAPDPELLLIRVKMIRKIARAAITHLGRVEDFKKAAWLRKKFVVRTDYCVSLDRLPEELYPEVAANVAQRADWVRHFSIDGIQSVPGSPGYSEPLTVEFLKANPNLPLDTRHFPRPFVDRLLHAIDDLDAATTGLLVHADNFSALSLLQARYGRSAKCVYADPPYNADGTPVAYRNGFKTSSWVRMVRDRLALCRPLLRDDGLLCATIDDCQHKELRSVLGQLFGEDRVAGTVVLRVNPSGRPIPSGFGVAHEYAIFAGRSPAATVHKVPRTEAQLIRYAERDGRGRYMWELFRKRGSESRRQDRPTMYYPLYARGENVRVPAMHWDPGKKEWVADEKPAGDERVLYPVDAKGQQRRWRWKHEAVSADPSQFRVRANRRGEVIVYYKYRPDEGGVIPGTVWTDAKYSATEHGTGTLKKLFAEYNVFDFPKSVFAVEDCLSVCGVTGDALCVDPFGGSGTTGHAVINLNRRDGGRRRFVLVEMGEHFQTVLKPRVLKVLYSDSWEKGKPLTRKPAGSYLLKYFDLETFDDALNNPDLARAIDAEGFRHPDEYVLQIERDGRSGPVRVDLAETFNWLLGLRVRNVGVVCGVRVVDGINPAGERVLVLWRDRDETGSEKLNEWFREQGYAGRDLEYDLVYVNGDNDLASLRRAHETWQVRLIESEFQRLMFDVRDV